LFSYGNSETAPFTELFYAGGANSIRAFNVRTIGPGAFHGIPGHKQMSYIIQNGDFKFVANLEYRRRLFGNLHGAIFLDAGNVWAKKDMEISTVNEIGEKVTKTYSDMTFRFPDAFKQLAVGTGIGLRYDLDFLILRLDWGLGLHLPYETSKKGFYNISRFKDSHSLHFAIGYPF
jgi:outer membrane protein assembly factor BamA